MSATLGRTAPTAARPDSVTEPLMAHFADNLQAMLDAGQAAAGPGRLDGKLPPLADEVEPPSDTAQRQPLAEPLGEAQSTSSADSLDALSLAHGMAQAQLRRPERVVQVLVVTVLLAYRLGWAAGRRSGRREACRWMTASLN